MLAGGRSERFGSDKLRAELDGEMLLSHAVRTAAAVAGEVWVVGGHAVDPPPVDHFGLDAPVRIVRDLLDDAGPLAGAYTGLAAAAGELVVLLAGDAPHVPPDLLRAMVAEARAKGAAVALAYEGRPNPMPSVLPRERSRAVIGELLVSGERRLRAIIDALPMVVLDEAFWRPLDPRAAWTKDVDEPADLSEA